MVGDFLRVRGKPNRFRFSKHWGFVALASRDDILELWSLVALASHDKNFGILRDFICVCED